MSDFREQALHYHSHPVPGKISIELIVIKRLEFVKDRLTPPKFISGPIL